MKNFQDSLNKWLAFHSHVASLQHMKTTSVDRKNYWARKIWDSCGFCDEFIVRNKESQSDCDKCPLHIAGHCNVWWPNLGQHALMQKIRNKYYDIDVTSYDAFKTKKIELLSLIVEFVKEMTKYIEHFESIYIPDIELYDKNGNEIGILDGLTLENRIHNANKQKSQT